MTLFPDLSDYPTIEPQTPGYLYWHIWDIDDTGLYFTRRAAADFTSEGYEEPYDYLGECTYQQAERFAEQLPDDIYPKIEPLQFQFNTFLASCT